MRQSTPFRTPYIIQVQKLIGTLEKPGAHNKFQRTNGSITPLHIKHTLEGCAFGVRYNEGAQHTHGGSWATRFGLNIPHPKKPRKERSTKGHRPRIKG